jgi:hypothetical protein
VSEPVIVNPQGKPARAPKSDACPRCGKGKENRRQVHAFGGDPYDVCLCGHEFKEDVNA